MGRLSAALQYYVHLRLNTDPGWRGIKVIMSDASVPGEGEHKAMHYIRQQRGQKGFDPNTKHVVYGLDADLIMLALATHEPNFWILREVVFQKNAPEPDVPSARDQILGQVPKDKPAIARKPYQLLSVAVLRRVSRVGSPPRLRGWPPRRAPFPLDIERLFDDFVFMCFFVGNDFLPHSPTLEIREGAIDLIMTIYRQELPRLGGYLCCDGKPDLRRVERFVAAVGQHEEAIFQSARAQSSASARAVSETRRWASSPAATSSSDAARGTLADSPTRPTPGSASVGPSTPPTAHRGRRPKCSRASRQWGADVSLLRHLPPPSLPGRPKPPTRNPT